MDQEVQLEPMVPDVLHDGDEPEDQYVPHEPIEPLEHRGGMGPRALRGGVGPHGIHEAGWGLTRTLEAG